MLKTESYKRGLFYSTGLNIIAKGVGFVNTLILAYYFGANASTDIYFMVLSIAIIITGIINGTDFLVLIPEAMKLRERESEDASRKFLNFFLYIYFIIGVLLALLIIISPVLFYSIFSKFDTALLNQNNKILYVGSIIILFQLLNNLLGAILSSYKFFTASIFSSLINSVFAIVITVCFHRQLGIVGTISGIALGYIINFILLVSILKYYKKWNFFKGGWIKNKVVWGNIGLIQLNNLPIWVRNSVTLYLLSGLGNGVLTSVTLAQQITSIIDILLVSQVIAVVGIKLSEYSSKAEYSRTADLFYDVSKMLLLLVIPLVTLTVIYPDEITGVFFTKKSLGADILANIEMALRYLIILAPYSILNNLCTRLFASFQIIANTIVLSFISHIVFLLLAVLLITNFGLIGYLWSMIAGFTVLMGLLYIILKRKFPQIRFLAILYFALKQALFNAIFAFSFYLLNENYLFLHGIPLMILALIMQGFFAIGINYRNPNLINFAKRIYAYTHKISR